MDDYGSFRWAWAGTGTGDQFDMDRDCGITASTYSPFRSGTGVVAKTDCVGFETLATSRKVTDLLASDTPCGTLTDDVGTMTLVLVDGGKLFRSVTGCGSTAPVSTLELEMRRLSELYAYPDAGSDTVDGD